MYCETQFKKDNSQKRLKTVSRLSFEKLPSMPLILDILEKDINDSKMKLEQLKEYFEEKLNPAAMTHTNILNSFPIIDRDPLYLYLEAKPKRLINP